MVDEIDKASEHETRSREDAIRAARRKEIPKGVAGECDLCGEFSGRLVYGACAPCRDKFKLG